MAIDRNLVQGSMAMMILRLLETKDMYGYEMIEALRERSNNVFELKAGTLYLCCTRWRAVEMWCLTRTILPARRENTTS